MPIKLKAMEASAIWKHHNKHLKLSYLSKFERKQTLTNKQKSEPVIFKSPREPDADAESMERLASITYAIE